jgi:anhydro-N-acetylmuramic acid kinase
MLNGLLPEIKIKTHEDFGIPNQAKEALAFAILANEVVFNSPNNVPRATGARKRVVLGKIVPGG